MVSPRLERKRTPPANRSPVPGTPQRRPRLLAALTVLLVFWIAFLIYLVIRVNR